MNNQAQSDRRSLVTYRLHTMSIHSLSHLTAQASAAARLCCGMCLLLHQVSLM